MKIKKRGTNLFYSGTYDGEPHFRYGKGWGVCVPFEFIHRTLSHLIILTGCEFEVENE